MGHTRLVKRAHQWFHDFKRSYKRSFELIGHHKNMENEIPSVTVCMAYSVAIVFDAVLLSRQQIFRPQPRRAASFPAKQMTKPLLVLVRVKTVKNMKSTVSFVAARSDDF